jgi:hypothetical protein
MISSSDGVYSSDAYAHYLLKVPLGLTSPLFAMSLASTANQRNHPPPMQLLSSFVGGIVTITNDSLWFVNPYLGSAEVLGLGHQTASGAVAMTLYGDSDIYMVRSNSLYLMSLKSQYAPILVGENGQWIGVTAMTSVRSELYIINYSGLWAVRPGI